MKTILLVDDNRSLLDSIELVLDLNGYTVWKAESAEQALKVLDAHTASPDLILSDVIMLEMTGIQLRDVVARNVLWQDIPFLFMTAFPIFSYGLHQHDYVLKPFTADDLLSAISAKIHAN
jgi:CheY-like chemotaxis protein